MDQRLPDPAGAAPPDWRGLCEELISLVEQCPVTSDTDWIAGRNDLIVRFHAAKRSALAQPEPEVVGPDTDAILALAAIIREVDGNHALGAAALAEAILSHPGSSWGRPAPAPAGERQAAPVPVAVSERLPQPEDCDAEGFCWWFSPADPSAGTFGVAACWVLRKYDPEDDFRTHWLPAHALPLPSGEVEHG